MLCSTTELSSCRQPLVSPVNYFPFAPVCGHRAYGDHIGSVHELHNTLNPSEQDRNSKNLVVMPPMLLDMITIFEPMLQRLESLFSTYFTTRIYLFYDSPLWLLVDSSELHFLHILMHHLLYLSPYH